MSDDEPSRVKGVDDIDRDTVEGSAELRALQALRDAAVDLLAREADPSLSDDVLAPVRDRAATCYRDYVAEFGPLNRGLLRELQADPQTGLPRLAWRRPDLGGFRSDPHHLTVMALETFDQATGRAEPAAILTRRVNGVGAGPSGRVANAYEALAVSLDERGVDLALVGELLDLPEDDSVVRALGDLVYRDPRDGTWRAARDYLSGDVRAEHALAVAAAVDDPQYRRNVAALADVMPADLGPSDIAVSLGAPWLDPGDIEDFIHEVLGGRVKVWHLPSAAAWKIVPTGRVPPAVIGTFATSRLNAYDLLTAGLNGRSPIVWDVGYEAGRKVRVRNVEASLAAHQRLAQLQERFATWVWEDATRCRRLCREYNRRFNAHVVRPYDGSQLTFPGLADGIELWPWQRDIVARIISSPATLCGHAVGAGKTRSMICAAMTARRLGLADKPLLAVPAHLVEQTAREARQAYPFGRFLVAGEDSDLTGRGGAAVAARCATGDWDAVIMSHGMFSAVPVHPDTEFAWLGTRHDDLERQLRAGQGGRFGRSELRRRLAAVQSRIEALAIAPAPAVPFESLGVDLLLIDEAHYFKRLPVVTRREGMRFGSSQRAVELMLKARTLRARRGRRPSLVLFTGTPWSNTIAETFVWQSFLQPDVLAAAGVEHFDAWAATFVDYETTVEVTPDTSGFRATTRPSRIRNAPELRTMFSRCADVLPGTDLDLERPLRRDRTIVCEPGVGQLAYVRSLGARADKIRREGMTARPGEDNMLVLCNDGRRAALDPQLVGVREDSTKLAALADEIARTHREHAADRFPDSERAGVLQLVFCDQGTPGDDGPQTYGRLRVALAERGVPVAQIRWVHAARTPAARAALFAACRDGEVAVLIGSTDKVGVGTNIQQRLRAVHHADAPWRPSDVEQREGRALRPGNLNPTVDICRYVTRGSFDAYMWQTLERKARFVQQLYGHGGSGSRTIDDLGDSVLGYAEVKALATGNPLLLEQAQAAAEVHRLHILRSLDTQTVTAARAALRAAEGDEARSIRLETLLRAARDRLAWHDARGRDRPSGAGREAAAGGAASVTAAVDAAVDAVLARLGGRRDADSASMDPNPVRVSWRGLGVELLPRGGWAARPDGAIDVRLTLAHRRVDDLVVHPAAGRRGPVSYRAAVRRALERWRCDLDQRITGVARSAAAAHDGADDARSVIATHRFDRADELSAAVARLAEIETELEAAIRHS